MPREKDLEIGLLLDFYGEMLSPEKREAVRLYYDEDLSLAEIAGDTDITRQGVRDRIEKAKVQLMQLEDTLGLAKKSREIDDRVARVTEMLEELRREADKDLAPDIDAIIREIKNITI